MHQESWIYRGKLKRHLLQLSHDFSNDYLILNLDGVSLVEDRLKKKDKEKVFNVFIDQELCEIKVIREGKNFKYEFVPHVYSTSKVGKTRKKAAKRELISVNTGVVILAVTLLSGLIYFLFFSNHSKPALSLGGLTTVATISEINANQKHVLKDESGKTKLLTGNIRYKFEVGKEEYKGDAFLYKKIDHYFLASTGLPIQTGDEFMVLYDKDNPLNNKILFDHPSERKLKQYDLMGRESCLKNLPSNIPKEKDLQYCECLKAYFFQQYNLTGLAHLIHQGKRKTSFADFNEETYQKFMGKERQQKIQKNCLGAIGE